MSRKMSLGATIMLMAMTAAVAVTVTMIYAMRVFNVNLSDYTQRIAIYKKLSAVDNLVRTQYIGAVDSGTLTDDVIRGYIAGIGDSHAAYYDASTYSKTQLGLQGKGVGIGVNIIENTDGNIKVVSVMSGSPAQKAGLKDGDIITEIGSNTVISLGYENAINLLRGNTGTTAQFTVLRGGKPLPFSIVRKQFDMQTVHAHMINNTGFIRIDEFDENTAAQFTAAIKSLDSKGALSFVFDLRNNPGGEVEAAAKMLEQLLPAGPIVRVRYKDGKSQVLYSSDGKQELKVPMVVLVNSGTASAAELFTAALRDYNKAKIIGTKTYGKGTMQKYYELSDGSAVKFSVAYFDPPVGANFDGKGIEPDISVTLSQAKTDNFYELTDAQDDQLQAALTYLAALSS
ncbi:MAG: S41 family peptidase [Clostridia bacterium]|nr:S41 family peptidase [Clostridia bacterium]MDR3643845.1 S41 family peptidase [Clostridia bacterium]